MKQEKGDAIFPYNCVTGKVHKGRKTNNGKKLKLKRGNKAAIPFIFPKRNMETKLEFSRQNSRVPLLGKKN